MDYSNVSSVFVLNNDASKADILASPEFNEIVSKKIQIIERPTLSEKGPFDLIIAVESDVKNNEDTIFSMLKPSGQLCLCSPTNSLSFSLKVAGFVAKSDKVFMKPAYEMGSAVQVEQKNVWTVNMDDDMGDEALINDDDLLDEQDRVKPNAEELRVCATTKQRKACANCSCGLKEELESEEINKIKENSQNAKSSCGNCYLGDAFRCAGCPYRGLPAFKPGEKVTIDVSDDL